MEPTVMETLSPLPGPDQKNGLWIDYKQPKLTKAPMKTPFAFVTVPPALSAPNHDEFYWKDQIVECAANGNRRMLDSEDTTTTTETSKYPKWINKHL